MPKATFYNLNKEKREKIDNAIKKEFSRTSFSNASISRIIEDAQIPRGSFYQYFEDKEDAIKYTIENFIETEKKEMKKILEKNNGDIFQAMIDLYIHVVQQNEKQEDLNLCRNILQRLKEDNISIITESRKENLKNKMDDKNIVNKQKLNLRDEKDFEYIIKILTIVVRNETIQVISKLKDKDQGKKDIEREIELLKEGLTKK